MLRIHLVVLALAAGALVSLVSSGCGEGAGSSTLSTKTSAVTRSAKLEALAESAPTSAPELVSRAELIAKGNAICRRINARRAATRLGGVGQETVARVIPPLAAYEVQALSAMRKLSPPASMAKSWNQIVNETNTLVEVMVAVGKAAQERKLESTRVLDSTLTNARIRLHAIAKRSGFPECAKRT